MQSHMQFSNAQSEPCAEHTLSFPRARSLVPESITLNPEGHIDFSLNFRCTCECLPTLDHMALVIVHETMTIRAAMPYVSQRMRPLPCLEICGHSRDLLPKCPTTHSVWGWWKDFSHIGQSSEVCPETCFDMGSRRMFKAWISSCTCFDRLKIYKSCVSSCRALRRHCPCQILHPQFR